ncbi:MAG: hypothetical protein ACKOBX_06980 [Bacteroidota bacterium]
MRSFLFILMYVIGGQFHSFAQDKTSDGNFFKSAYHQQVTEGKSITAECSNHGYFKSNSGWKDGKYYLLINEVLPGTIVKIELQSTQRTIYAKVLGPLTPTNENEGLMLRLSAASLASLGIKDNNGRITLTWNK